MGLTIDERINMFRRLSTDELNKRLDRLKRRYLGEYPGPLRDTFRENIKLISSEIDRRDVPASPYADLSRIEFASMSDDELATLEPVISGMLRNLKDLHPPIELQPYKFKRLDARRQTLSVLRDEISKRKTTKVQFLQGEIVCLNAKLVQNRFKRDIIESDISLLINDRDALLKQLNALQK